jgi:hypothetical protein
MGIPTSSTVTAEINEAIVAHAKLEVTPEELRELAIEDGCTILS